MPDFIFAPFLFCLALFRMFLSIFLFWLPHARRNFENKNIQGLEAKSFKKENIVADFCFEVSSEGELEQVRPLLLFYLNQKKYIELIFSSPSVEKKCLGLWQKFPENLRLFRLPLLTTQLIQNWITAPVIIFCRYDFFPELLMLKYFEKKLVLVSGTVKNLSWYKKNAFSMFSIIVAATKSEEKHFKLIAPRAQTFAFDFRIPRIAERFYEAANVLAQHQDLINYVNFLKKFKKSERIIIGSSWGSDLSIFNNHDLMEEIKQKKLHLLLVPHQLSKEKIDEIKNYLLKVGLGEYLSILGEVENFTPIIILNKSGILCELYSLFGHAYIGGGFERSIHSVFEPFFSGCQVYCGIKIGRSTEYDLLEEIAPNEIHVLKQGEDFYNVYMNNKELNVNLELRDSWRQSAQDQIIKIASAIDAK